MSHLYPPDTSLPDDSCKRCGLLYMGNPCPFCQVELHGGSNMPEPPLSFYHAATEVSFPKLSARKRSNMEA